MKWEKGKEREGEGKWREDKRGKLDHAKQK